MRRELLLRGGTIVHTWLMVEQAGESVPGTEARRNADVAAQIREVEGAMRTSAVDSYSNRYRCRNVFCSSSIR